ncbi:hypothetical protein [Bacillus cereus]|uniref:hypothetical protein n=1 Tax=Bacillus cereus TaxID=1396 RepID=UPI000BEBCEB4|nr:hypothetical protein [Bacillus cereus]PEE49756.1 hypothetical protein COM80_28975 [Bacillus cereus]PFV63324.1 hypothetical protein COL16_28820 [Bacillus cereus]PGY64371.1 hypothetical protein COE34_28385 [Bacillus cereus]
MNIYEQGVRQPPPPPPPPPPTPSQYIIDYQKSLLIHNNFVQFLYQTQPANLPPPPDSNGGGICYGYYGSDGGCILKWSIVITVNRLFNILTPHLVFVFDWQPVIDTVNNGFVTGIELNVITGQTSLFASPVGFTGCP